MPDGKRLSAIIPPDKILETRGNIDRFVTGIAYDSREIKTGDLFFACRGLHVDGHRYIADAAAKGAYGVIQSDPLPPSIPAATTFVRVAEPQILMSPVSAAFYDHPSEKLRVVGVTGTDGKSTTVSFIHQLLEAAGEAAGFVSTVEYKAGKVVRDNPYRQSTPEASEIQHILAQMVNSGKTFAVIEATSHGLSPRTKRLGDVAFEGAVFTNVTREHLEFHGSLEQYRADKAELFRRLNRNAGDIGFGVVNADDPNADFFRRATRKKTYTYSLRDPAADLCASEWKADEQGIDFWLCSGGVRHPARINQPGLFNVENAMAALLASSVLLGRPVAELLPHLPELVGVKGRMTRIDKKQPFNVTVDYAHTPGAFEKLFAVVRPTAKGRIIVVFGSAGERDTGKRSEQGGLAHKNADIVILADEDPRGENRLAILEQIAEGCPGRNRGEDLFLIPDRKEAIRTAFSLAIPGDTVLLLGKGHESSIIQAEGKTDWDEIAVAEELLKERGFF